jgi:hypothetical protein
MERLMKLMLRVVVEGVDITNKVQDRLLSLSVTDKSGIESDGYQLTLDNRDGKISIPNTGVKISISAGIEQLYYLGSFTVDSVSESGPVRTLTLSGSSADLTAQLKSHQQANWDNTKLEDVLNTIAVRHKLELALHDRFKAITIEHLDQTGESDLALITRLAKDYNALFKIADSKLIFTQKQAAQTLNGKQMPAQLIDVKSLTQWQYQQSERSEVTQVKSKWRDKEESNERWEALGEKGVLHIINTLFRSKIDAIEAAKSQLEKLQSSKETLSLTMAVTKKTPLIRAEHRIMVSELNPSANGEWVAESVTHNISNQGYSLQIEALKPAQAFN